MFISKLSINRPIMVGMGLSVFLLFGILAYLSLPLNLMPSIKLPYVTIQTVYPGAGPSELETLVTDKIEDAVSTLGKIKKIQSFSMENVSFVVMEFEPGKDADTAIQEVRDKVGAIADKLPEDALKPVIDKIDINASPVMDLILSGSAGRHQLSTFANDILKEQLSQVEGVGKVNIIGEQDREIRVEFDNRTVYQNRLSLPQLAQILAAHNLDLPGGYFEEQSQEFSVRMKGAFTETSQIGDIEIPTAFGTKKVRDLAKVLDTTTEIREKTTFFDVTNQNRTENVILISIVNSTDGNVVEMTDAVKKRLIEIKEQLPSGMELSVIKDDSEFIRMSVRDTLGNIILGVILTGLVLLFFLHDLRSTLIVAVAMPFSIISTFFLVQYAGFSLNMMTLMGLSTAVGVLVTNSVVVLENIFRLKERGLNRKDAADQGTAGTAVAVIASTMTNIVVFVPIANMGSMVGQMFKEFALTVSFATLFSIVVSFTVTPMLAALILPKKQRKPGKISRGIEAAISGLERAYGQLLSGILKRKLFSAFTVLLAIGLFMGVMFKIAPKVPFEFFPNMDQGNISVEVELPEGYNLDETVALMRLIEERISNYDEVKHIITTLGSLSDLDVGANQAIAKVKLVDKEQRSRSSFELVSEFTRDLSTVPNTVIRISNAAFGPGMAPIQFHLKGPNDEKLNEYSKKVIEAVNDVPGLINLKTGTKVGKPEISLTPFRRKVSEAGLTVADLAFTLRASLEGAVATQYREGGEEYDVRVTLNEASANTPEKIGNIVVVSPKGTFKLSQLAEINYTRGFNKVLHMDKAKSIEFSASTAEGYALGDVVAAVQERLDKIALDEGYRIDLGGDSEAMQETVFEMGKAFLIALLLTYMLLAAILESLTQPIMILATVPLSFIGVFIAMFITGSTMNVISMMAVIMLLGIVVNNAILLLDYTNTLRRDGMPIQEALKIACPSKLKPIIMSTLAIILGMMPLALGIGEAGAETRQPMGIVSVGGLVVSALMTLFVIPAIYNLFSREKKS